MFFNESSSKAMRQKNSLWRNSLLFFRLTGKTQERKTFAAYIFGLVKVEKETL